MSRYPTGKDELGDKNVAKTAAKTISYKRVQNSDFGHDDNRENRVQRQRAISTKRKLTQTMSMTESGSILAVPSSTVPSSR